MVNRTSLKKKGQLIEGMYKINKDLQLLGYKNTDKHIQKSICNIINIVHYKIICNKTRCKINYV